MSSWYRCCVPGCVESGGSHPVLHGFPNPEKDPDRFRSWIYAVGGDILGLSNQYIHKYRRVCHNHFEEKHCCRFDRISRFAVPTKNIAGPMALPQFTYTDRAPLRSRHNLLCDSPSTSKDPVFPDSEMESCEHTPQIFQDEEKENFNQVKGVSPTVSRKRHHAEDTEKERSYKESSHRKRKFLSVAEISTPAPGPSVKTPWKRIFKKTIMTDQEKELLKKVTTLRVKVSQCRNKLQKQRLELKSAKKIFTNAEFVKITENMTSSAKLLTLMQFREYKKREKGRRFADEEKILALTLYKQSPKCYRFLRRIFILPSQQTLQKMLHKCSLRPGINKNIFAQLKRRAEKMKPEHKLCILLFDEMQLNANIAFNERKDEICGFVANGVEIKKDLGDHAQVFMIRGLVKNYKQPVAYTFSSKATKGPELAKQLKTVIAQLQEAGFEVLATVCDQGTNNRQAIKLLKEEARSECLRKGLDPPNKNIFQINSKEIIPLFDTPHLIKCIRNNLLTKNLKYKIGEKSGTAKWQHLEMLFQENPAYEGLRLIPSLTESHVIPSKIPKMKVKYATQIFSRAVASNMGYLSSKGILPEECQQTADFLLFMDNLFDSVNGSYVKNRHAKPLLGPVTPKSIHKKIWIEARKILSEMSFVNKTTGAAETVPTINGWITTLEGIELLINKLNKNHGITSVWMRHINQDPLENFFGAVRSNGCRNTNPTPGQFESTFTTLLINNMSSVHTPGFNCEQDNGELLHALLFEEDIKGDSIRDVDLDEILSIDLKDISSKSDPRVMGPLKYISGFFIKKMKRNIFGGCEICTKSLVDEDGDAYIKIREYEGRKWLYSPKPDYLQAVSHIQDVCYYMIPKNITKPLIKEYLKVIILTVVNFNFLKCQEHVGLKNYLLNQIVRFFIFNYCKTINKIIAGKRGVDDETDPVQLMAKKYCSTYVKNKKK